MSEADMGRLAQRYRRELLQDGPLPHELYQASDFNSDERQRRNRLYVMVVEGGLSICKRCGAGEADLATWPTCQAFRRAMRSQREESKR